MPNVSMLTAAIAVVFPIFLASPWASGAEPETSNAAVPAQEVPLTPSFWDISGDAELITHEGRRALKMSSGRAVIRDRSFATGYLEVDMLVTGERSFPGVDFRGADEANYESFYIRPHQSGNPDASQYIPIFNASAPWQIYLGDGFTAPFKYALGEWFKLRIDLYQDSALVSVDGTPLLHIDDLIMDQADGFIGLSANFAGALFSNVSLAPIPGYSDPVEKALLPPPDSGTILRWQVSAAMPEEEALSVASTSNWNGSQWTTVTAENSGVANLAKGAHRSADNLTTIARFTLQSSKAGEARMAFAFSDKVEIFLNGRPLYRGNDTYATRDYRFLGSVGFFDELTLPLKAGRNDVAFVVTESFGGWAAGAKLIGATGDEAPEIID